LMRKFRVARRMYVFKEHEQQDEAEITEDFVLDRLLTFGSGNKVVDELLAFHDEVGPFGELVYAGMDWVDPALTKRSMELMATEVMPRVNAALASGKSTRAGARPIAQHPWRPASSPAPSPAARRSRTTPRSR